MNKRIRIYAVIGVIIVLLGFLIVSLPQERLLHSEEYTDLEFYPTYYYTNFTVASLDTNAELSFDLNIDFGDNYTNCTTFWILYQLELEQFEENFNLTETRAVMMGENWNVVDALWVGGSSIIFPFWESVPSSAYVFVFWFESDEPTNGWSATLSFSLRTRILPLM